MTEMIERVARILCGLDELDPDAACDGPSGEVWIGWFAYASRAHDIIEAMWEPTEAMMEAGAHPGNGGGPDECWMHPPEARTAWKAMISAALSEP